MCGCDREEVQSFRDARLSHQSGDGTSAVLGAGRIAHLEAELRDAKVCDYCREVFTCRDENCS